MCSYTNNHLTETITKCTDFSHFLWGDGMRAKGGNGSIFLQLVLFNLTFFILFAYYSHGDSRNVWTGGLGPLFGLISPLYFTNGSKF